MRIDAVEHQIDGRPQQRPPLLHRKPLSGHQDGYGAFAGGDGGDSVSPWPGRRFPPRLHRPPPSEAPDLNGGSAGAVAVVFPTTSPSYELLLLPRPSSTSPVREVGRLMGLKSSSPMQHITSESQK